MIEKQDGQPGQNQGSFHMSQTSAEMETPDMLGKQRFDNVLL